MCVHACACMYLCVHTRTPAPMPVRTHVYTHMHVLVPPPPAAEKPFVLEQSFFYLTSLELPILLESPSPPSKLWDVFRRDSLLQRHPRI